MKEREKLGTMSTDEFKARIRSIIGEDPEQTVIGAVRPHPLLMRKRTASRTQKRR